MYRWTLLAIFWLVVIICNAFWHWFYRKFRIIQILYFVYTMLIACAVTMIVVTVQ